MLASLLVSSSQIYNILLLKKEKEKEKGKVLGKHKRAR
jgi:hypothetical protein